jgi:hypothetical protein
VSTLVIAISAWVAFNCLIIVVAAILTRAQRRRRSRP